MTLSAEDKEFTEKITSRNIFFNVTTVITLLVFFVGMTWYLSQEKHSIDGRIAQNAQKIDILIDKVNSLVRTIENPNRQGFTRQTWINECLRHQIINPTWRCGYAIPLAWQATIIEQNARR